MNNDDIRALARELTDRQWSVVFTVAPDPTGMWGSVRIADLLAYLDEVWAGLTKDERYAVTDLATDGWTTDVDLDRIVSAGLVRRGASIDEPDFIVAPTCRAVLRRAKDTGRA